MLFFHLSRILRYIGQIGSGKCFLERGFGLSYGSGFRAKEEKGK